MLPSSWRPEAGIQLVRVGPDEDGGYVVPAKVLGGTDVLVSLGLNDDWRFEESFRRLSGARVECFDHTVTRSFWRWRAVHRLVAMRKMPGTMSARWRDVQKWRDYRSFFAGLDVVHHQVMVGFESPPGSLSLRSILGPHLGCTVFVKMDVEGWEYRVIKQLLEASESVVGFVVEFHDVDLHRDLISGFIESATDYAVVHVHANNYGGTDPAGDPLVLEFTFARRDLLEPDLSGVAASVDFPNCPELAEIPVHFAERVSGSDFKAPSE